MCLCSPHQNVYRNGNWFVSCACVCKCVCVCVPTNTSVADHVWKIKLFIKTKLSNSTLKAKITALQPFIIFSLAAWRRNTNLLRARCSCVFGVTEN